MKELSIKEKAKRYDKAVKEAKSKMLYPDKPCFVDIREIFPELVESEEEKVDNQNCVKPVDEVEPKFKVGDWIIDVQGVSANQIIGYEDDSYYIETSCSKFYLPMKLTEKNYRPWTIQDAKDGDVLAAKSGNRIFLYNGNCDLRHRPCAYCGTYKGFSEILFSKCAIGNYFTDEDVYPATKEQRHLLFQEMNKAGYIWNPDKKEPNKIEQKPANEVEIPFGAYEDL